MKYFTLYYITYIRLRKLVRNSICVGEKPQEFILQIPIFSGVILSYLVGSVSIIYSDA